GHHTAYSYDAAGGLTEITSAGRRVRFEHDRAGRETRRELGPAAILSHEWDSAGRPTAQIVTPLTGPSRRRAHSFHPNRLLSGITDSRAGDIAFTLDAEGRITAVDSLTGGESYRYDSAGNQTEARWPAELPDAEATGDRSYSGTRLTRAGRMRYEHDACGRVVLRRLKRLSGKTDTWRYTWDGEDHLVGLVTPDSTTWRYLYDPFGRRVAKERLAEDGSIAERTDYTWAGSVVTEETTASRDHDRRRTLTWDYRDLHPLAQTERVTPPAEARQRDIDARFFAIVTDLVGAPAELIDESGETAWRATATVWGAVGRGADAMTDTPLRFPGQYADQETGWHYNFHRHYDPATGRYTSPDPLGLAPARNPMAYVPNPQAMSDPTGLAPCNPTPYRPRSPRGRPDGQLVFSGHGGFRVLTLFQRSVVVPEGTSIAFYSRHGQAIANTVGGAVEIGRPLPIVDTATGNVVRVENPVPVQVFGPGDRVPNYTLYPPEELRVRGDPITVGSPTRLGDLLQPNLGQVHWAACRNRML
ncbi:type IV secretion protein Rhs, partial [Streptomyces sp. 8K308]|uniref:RHS repeat-associated core domain-containing protein n=1 Tax=Streptomyces sp. 8K308 TaxID=2530388 RepID=UPI0010D25082